MTQLAISVRRAESTDAADLANLINRAFSVEGFFVEGDRTTTAEIARMCRTGNFIVLEGEAGLAASVYVQAGPGGATFGMLAVDPSVQGMGLGTRLVRIAEAMAEAMGASTMSIELVNLREELMRWYGGLGYRPVGTAPFVEHRTVKQPCHFVAMQRTLAAPALAAA